ncbi:MAG TPA: hypothetical protein VL688_03210 [Verrucomicrobiae bacterium]|jgi:hypothetical protein|nr:hypothetical protein [Verrucomicrobiae bacterium]
MLPFTFILLAVVAAAGFWAGTHTGVLSDPWLEKIGYAPADLGAGRLGRMFVSTFFTDGPKSLVLAMAVTLLAVGGLERVAGTARAVLTFWGAHTLTLLFLSVLMLLPLRPLTDFFGEELKLVRDVGPSAGYFGCLGALMLGLGAWRWPAIAAVFAGLIVVFCRPAAAGENPLVKKHADLAHLTAFFFGVLSGMCWPLGKT